MTSEAQRHSRARSVWESAERLEQCLAACAARPASAERSERRKALGARGLCRGAQTGAEVAAAVVVVGDGRAGVHEGGEEEERRMRCGRRAGSAERSSGERAGEVGRQAASARAAAVETAPRRRSGARRAHSAPHAAQHRMADALCARCTWHPLNRRCRCTAHLRLALPALAACCGTQPPVPRRALSSAPRARAEPEAARCCLPLSAAASASTAAPAA
jgi:hypothetical protein